MFLCIVTESCTILASSTAKAVVLSTCYRQISGYFPLQKKSRPTWGTKKLHRNVKLHVHAMADPAIEIVLAPLRASVKEQGDIVRELKAAGAPELDIKKAVANLKHKKKLLDDKEVELMPAIAYFDRAKLEDLLKRRFFYDQSFSIYGGITGQYDFGPVGCSLKMNILDSWRKWFVLKEKMFEVDCSILTPEQVLKASGHVDRFADLMVKDTVNGECFRLDHLIKAQLEKLCMDKKTSAGTKKECEDIITKLDGFKKEELQAILLKYDIKSPLTGNKLTEPIEFNLMFGTQIGPVGTCKGYLRPETAQGIFVNFKRLLEFNQDKLPFAAAQIGNAFRNEISPRSGLLRVREFTMAEIEHFCSPHDKSHKKFPSIANEMLTLYSSSNQMDGKSAQILTIGEAVESGMVANETLGYFMTRIFQFLVYIGIDEKRLRFRQHMPNEMAHYACDCWDAECLTSYGWVECVGCADRSAYDLTQHYKATGVRLAAEKKLLQPKIVDVTKAVVNKTVVGKTFKKEMKLICDELSKLSVNEVLDVENKLNKNGEYVLRANDQEFKLTKDMVSVTTTTETKHVEEIIPSVIEPSFGIGRIMYSLFEHNFRIREADEARTYLSIPAHVAPFKCAVLPLSSNDQFLPIVEQIADELEKRTISHKIDDSAGSIGKRYTRSDEIAIPFDVTVDFDSLKEPHTATLRERDSTSQIRIPVTDVVDIVERLTNGNMTWEEACSKYPKFTQQETIK